MEKGQLLLKFLNEDEQVWIENNKELLASLTDKVIILAPLNSRNPTKYLYFKTDEEVDIKKHRFIKINKNSNTNTLYTINGLNKAIERDNPDVDGNHIDFTLDWDKYKGVILMENKNFNSLKIVKTRLKQEIFFN